VTKVTLITPSFPARAAFLHRVKAHFPVGRYEWIVCGPSGVAETCREVGALHVCSDAEIGTLRNLACEAATGDIVVQVDDDDWQSPGRVDRQVQALTRPMPGQTQRPELAVSSWLYCLDVARAVASRISWWDATHGYVGASFAFWRSSWRQHPFPDGLMEDGVFSAHFHRRGTALDMRDPKLIVYIRSHGRHLPRFGGDWWRETRDRVEERRTALHTYQDRIRHPNRPLAMSYAETDRDLAIAHEEEAATVYVRWLMGSDFALFCSERVT